MIQWYQKIVKCCEFLENLSLSASPSLTFVAFCSFLQKLHIKIQISHSTHLLKIKVRLQQRFNFS